jgi:hypothetical protein
MGREPQAESYAANPGRSSSLLMARGCARGMISRGLQATARYPYTNVHPSSLCLPYLSYPAC